MIGMDNRELEALLQDLESDRVERKSSDADRNTIRQAVCAFANDLPGYGKHRNPHLAEVMKNLGYVQRFGFGIPTAKRALQRNGNPHFAAFSR